MRAYCYIHIGAPKTGSTFLQQVFYENRHELRQFGLLYPEVSIRGYGHHDIAFLLSGGYPEWATSQSRTLDALAAELAAGAAGHTGSLLLSSENFYLFPEPRKLKQLLERTGALTRRSARIIVYLRRQDDAHESWYNQRVKAQGESGTIEESCECFHNLWDYERQLKLWSAAFGEDALVARRYDPSISKDWSLIEDMLRVLDIEGFIPHLSQHHINMRENRDILDFQRHVNRLPLSAQEKRRFHKELMTLSDRAKDQGLFDERPLLGASERQAIMDRYAAGNFAVSARYFSGEPLFSAVSEPDQGGGASRTTPVETGLTVAKMAYIIGWLLVYKDETRGS